MKNALILLALAGLALSACGKKDDKDLDNSIAIRGAWTMSTQTQQGQTLPASKPKTIEEFGTSSPKTTQLDIKENTLKMIETDSVQVFVTNYTWAISGSELTLVNVTSPGAAIEKIQFSVDADTLVFHTTSEGAMTFKKTSAQNLATSKALAIDVEQLVDMQFLVSVSGSTATPLTIPTSGTMKPVQTVEDAVRLKCSYNHQTKTASLEYTNIKDSPDSKINMSFDLNFNLATASENSLFSSTMTMDSSIYGKNIKAAGATCAGSMSRKEFFVKLDLRCNGLSLDGSPGNVVDLSGKIQCLF